jgi:hypothetical protein
MDAQDDIIWKLKLNDSVAALVGLIGTMCAIIENDILFDETPIKPRYVQNRACKMLRTIELITSIILSKRFRLKL